MAVADIFVKKFCQCKQSLKYNSEKNVAMAVAAMSNRVKDYIPEEPSQVHEPVQLLIYLWQSYVSVNTSENPNTKNVARTLYKVEFILFKVIITLAGEVARFFYFSVAIPKETMQIQEPVAVADIFVTKFCQCKHILKYSYE